MSREDKHDDLLLSILKDEIQVLPFLNTVFGFLYRRTDFYIIQDNPTSKLGFPPGVAEQIVKNVFRKWQKLATKSTHDSSVSSMVNDMTDVVIHEEEVVTSSSYLESKEVQPIEDKPNGSSMENDMTDQVVYEEEVVTSGSQQSTEWKPVGSKTDRNNDLSSDTYNGTDCGNYRWSRTILDVDVKVPVLSHVVKSSDVKLEISASRLSVRTRQPDGSWSDLMDGQLSHRHVKEESIWTLLPGRQITIHLQKASQKWWDSLLTTETKLDLTKLDVSRHVTDLDEEDHMQVEKVMVQEQRKRMGLLPSGHQVPLNILKTAWDLEGSPFQGTPFDPSVLHMPP